MKITKEMKKPTFLTNEFKGLQYEETKPIKPTNYCAFVFAMLIAFGLIVLAHKLGWIELTNNGGF